MKTLKTIVAGLLCSMLFAFSAQAQDGIERWSNNHPEASKALGEWVKAYPDAAHYIFEWDGNHPNRSQEFVGWALSHPKENLAVFHRRHRNWPEMDEIERTHKAGTEAFLIWCRNNPEAARTLMLHSAGLRWAGDHLYKTYLKMEK